MANSRFISGSGATPFEPDTPRTLLEGVTTLATTIALPTAADPALAAIKKKDLHPSAFESISSYNWVYGPGKRLKIIVPGYPSCWNPPPLPITLPPDTGFRMIHQNEYFSPGTPLRPMLRAVYTHRPDYEIRGVDVVTDRSSLLKLFKFVRGEVKDPPRPPRTTTTPARGGQGAYPGRGGLLTPPTSPSWRDRHLEAGGGGMRGRGAGLGYRGGGGGGLGGGVRRIGHQPMSMNPDREVRIDVDIMGGGGADGARASMLLSRWETHSAEVVPEGRFMGWGYQFLNRFTRFGDAGEEAVMDDGELQSHHRVVEYVMGGMRFLVRYHGDAITQSLAEFRFWAERERVEMRRRERKAAAAAVAERKAGAAGAAGAAEMEKREKREKRERKEREREKAEREKEAKAKGEGEAAARRKNMSPQAKKADDWLEKEFIEGLSKLTLGRVKTTIAIEAHKSLTPLYPHESIVGIKTCSEQSAPAMMLRAIPQVFFSQTPHLFIGYQRGGSFERVEKIETAALLRKWEEENEVVLKRYLVLLARIRTVVEGMEGRRATLVFVTGKENEGVKVYKRKEGTPGPVPSDLVAKWDV